MKPKSIAANVSLIIASIVVAMLIGEAALRVYQKAVYGIPFLSGLHDIQGSAMSPIELDDVLGWRATPNFLEGGYAENLDGSTFPVHVTSDANGFRVFGNVGSARPKILVIGDSFTQATDVSDGKTYYSLLGEALDAEIFAYGAGGYGTLQEYMILDRYFAEIVPDIVILQYCPNDFINNSLELEIDSKTSNNGMIRPYWIDGRIQYFMPKKHPVLRMFALKYSRIIYLILTRLDMIKAGFVTQAVGPGDEESFDPKAEQRARDTTQELLKMIHARLGGTSIIAFSSAKRAAADAQFRELSKKEGITYIDGVGLSVQAQQERGDVVRIKDGHWNEAGHRIVADRLVDYIRNSGLPAHKNNHGAIQHRVTK